MLNYELPYSVAELDAATKLVVSENKLDSGYVRPVAWRGSEVIGVSAYRHKRCMSQSQRFRGARTTNRRPSRSSRAAGSDPAPNRSPAGSKAAGLYIICTLAKDEAIAAGYQRCPHDDYKGRLSEATGANLFLVINGELHTPTTETILNGITRQTVMALAAKRGIKVIEREIYPDELTKASEVFLTGSAVEVQPVSLIDKREYQVGPISQQLQADYAALVRS